MPLRDFIMLIAGLFVCTGATVYNAYYGLLAYSWLSFMRPQSLAWTVQVQATRITLLVGALLVFRWLSTQGKRIRLQGPSTAFTMLWVWFAVTAFLTSMHPPMSYDPIVEFSKIGIAVLLGTALVQTRRELKWMMVLLAVCPGFWAIKLGLFFMRTATESQQGGPMGMDNNDTALFMALALPMMYFCACEVRNVWGRRFMYFGAAMAVPAVILTTSRGGLLALLAGLGFTVWRRTGRWMSPLTVTAAIAVVFYIAPASTTVRYSTIQTYQQDTSAVGRINAWRTSYNMAWAHPITGVGFGQDVYLAEYDSYSHNINDRPHAAHSVWFALMAETGFVGLGLYLWMLWQTLRYTGQIMRDSARHNGRKGAWDWNYAAALQCTIIAFAVGGTFLSQPRFEYVLMLCTMAVPLRALSLAEARLPLAESPAAAAPPGPRGLPAPHGGR